jgi:RNA polymerase primary sigma factor
MRQFKISERLTPRMTKASSTYLNDVEKTHPLAPDKEAEIAWAAASGDQEARDILVKANLRFVLSVAKMYAHSPEDYADLVAAGNIGLVEAATKFDPSRGFKFISYAVWHIRKEMLCHLSENNRTVRLPLNQINAIKKMMDVGNQISTKMGRDATFEETFEQIKTDNPKLSSLREDVLRKAMYADIRPASFNNPLSSDSTDTLLDIYDGGARPTDAMAVGDGAKEMLANLVSELKYEFREIVLRRHGIDTDTGEPEGFKEIGESIGLTGEAVRMRYKKAMKIMLLKARKYNYSIADVF